MITKLDRSAGSVIGYTFIGAVDKQDYAAMVPEMRALVEQCGTVQILCDLSELTSERPSAWRDDWHFGREFHEQITKMAVVGGGFDRLLADLAKPFYAEDVRYFANLDDAWGWLEG